MTEQIISFTPKAIAHIKTLMAKKSGAIGFRLSIKTTGCTGLMYVPELVQAANANDVHFAVDGLEIYIDADAVHAIKGSVVDLETKELGQTQLVFDNPNADSLCGCGESFNLKKDVGND